MVVWHTFLNTDESKIVNILIKICADFEQISRGSDKLIQVVP